MLFVPPGGETAVEHLFSVRGNSQDLLAWRRGLSKTWYLASHDLLCYMSTASWDCLNDSPALAECPLLISKHSETMVLFKRCSFAWGTGSCTGHVVHARLLFSVLLSQCSAYLCPERRRCLGIIFHKYVC